MAPATSDKRVAEPDQSAQPLGVCRSPIGKSPDGGLCYRDHRPDEGV
jgi:hypothetical protein